MANKDSQHAALATALRALLRPLVRLLVRQGFLFPAFSELVKSLYVDVAQADFRLQGREPSQSRINLLTGVHRKDVKRLRETPPDTQTQQTRHVSLGALLVARWTSLPEFLDKQGQPIALSRQAGNAAGPNFCQLVESVSKDIRPRVILDEWLHLGIVHIDEHNRVVLNQAAFVPHEGLQEKLFFFGRNVRDHLEACEHNLQESLEPMLERSVYYDQLSPESVQQLRDLAKQEGMDLLQRLNKTAARLQREDNSKDDAKNYFNFGIYWFNRLQKESSNTSGNDSTPKDSEQQQ